MCSVTDHEAEALFSVHDEHRLSFKITSTQTWCINEVVQRLFTVRASDTRVLSSQCEQSAVSSQLSQVDFIRHQNLQTEDTSSCPFFLKCLCVRFLSSVVGLCWSWRSEQQPDWSYRPANTWDRSADPVVLCHPADESLFRCSWQPKPVYVKTTWQLHSRIQSCCLTEGWFHSGSASVLIKHWTQLQM